MNAYALRLDLGPAPASVADVLAEIGDRLDAYDPRLSRPAADLELRLVVQSADLWQAVLLAMAAVTGTGYPVVALDAEPVLGGADPEPSGATSTNQVTPNRSVAMP